MEVSRHDSTPEEPEDPYWNPDHRRTRLVAAAHSGTHRVRTLSPFDDEDSRSESPAPPNREELRPRASAPNPGGPGYRIGPPQGSPPIGAPDGRIEDGTPAAGEGDDAGFRGEGAATTEASAQASAQGGSVSGSASPVPVAAPQARNYVWHLPLSDPSPNELLDGPVYEEIRVKGCTAGDAYLTGFETRYSMSSPRAAVFLSAAIAFCRANEVDPSGVPRLDAAGQAEQLALGRAAYDAGMAYDQTLAGLDVRPATCDVYRALRSFIVQVPHDSFPCPGGTPPGYRVAEYATDQPGVTVVVVDDPLTLDVDERDTVVPSGAVGTATRCEIPLPSGDLECEAEAVAPVEEETAVAVVAPEPEREPADVLVMPASELEMTPTEVALPEPAPAATSAPETAAPETPAAETAAPEAAAPEMPAPEAPAPEAPAPRRPRPGRPHPKQPRPKRPPSKE